MWLENERRARDSACLRVFILDLHRIKQSGRLHGADSRQEYEYYIEHFWKNETHMKSLFQEFPELYRVVRLGERQEAELRAEVYERLHHDREQITDVICHGKEFGGIADLDVTVGDPHRGGRRAVRVTLDNGMVLYYKPHSIDKAIAYQQVYRYFCDKAQMGTLPIGYLDYGSYGWEEHVPYAECQTREQIERYYFRMGIHLFLGYALSVTDLHGENIIACGEYPMIVDFETFPGYAQIEEHTDASRMAQQIVADSVLKTGMLPVLTWGQGKNTVLLSALGTGEKTQTPFKVPTVKHSGTSDMCIAYEPAELEIQNCVVRFKGTAINAADYCEALCEGFRFAYRIFLEDGRIEELLERFFNGRSRVLLRHTQQYVMYRFTSFHPELCVSTEKRKEFFSVLSSESDSKVQKQIHTYEADSLMNLDVPYFEIDSRRRSLFDGSGNEYRNYLLRTPYEAWKLRMGQFCTKDMDRQMDFIRLSVSLLISNKMQAKHVVKAFFLTRESNKTCHCKKNAKQNAIEMCQTKRESSKYGKEKVHTTKMYLNRVISKDELRHCIQNVLKQVCRSAVATRTGISWLEPFFYSDRHWKIVPSGVQFYDGIGGIAVFLAAYLKSFSDEKTRELFHLAQQELFRYTKQRMAEDNRTSVKTGILEGDGSVVFAYLQLYEITGEKKFLDYARLHFSVVEAAAQDDISHDLLGGNAGGIVLATKLHEITGETEYIEAAVRMEKQLWAFAVRMERGYGFQIADDITPLAGMAHGNSGFLVAYAGLWEMTDCAEYCEKILWLLEYEDSLYAEQYENWLDLRGKDNSEAVMNAWCHGAPGILLARMRLAKTLKRHSVEEFGSVQETVKMARIADIVERDIKRAARALFLQKPGKHICLCHGAAGNLLFMQRYLQIYPCASYQKRYEKLMQHFVLYFDSYKQKAAKEYLNPGFMNGISGVGFALLEMYKNR